MLLQQAHIIHKCPQRTQQIEQLKIQRRVNCIFKHSCGVKLAGFEVERETITLNTAGIRISVTFLQLQSNQFPIKGFPKGWSPTARESQAGHLCSYFSSCQPLPARMLQEPQNISQKAASGSFYTPCGNIVMMRLPGVASHVCKQQKTLFFLALLLQLAKPWPVSSKCQY